MNHKYRCMAVTGITGWALETSRVSGGLQLTEVHYLFAIPLCPAWLGLSSSGWWFHRRSSIMKILKSQDSRGLPTAILRWSMGTWLVLMEGRGAGGGHSVIGENSKKHVLMMKNPIKEISACRSIGRKVVTIKSCSCSQWKDRLLIEASLRTVLCPYARWPPYLMYFETPWHAYAIMIRWV